MRVFLRILLWLVVVIVILFLIGYFLPKSVYIERTATINASPETVYSIVNDLKTYDDWMPWNRIDPEMKKQYGEKTTGEGAWYTWQSENSEVGSGKLSIVESQRPTKVVTKLEFGGFDPSFGGWDISPSGNGAQVKWYMNSNMGNNPVYRWMGLFMEGMLGSQFEDGLAKLKNMAESKRSATAALAYN